MLDGVFELSHLTRSRNQLWSDLLANLEGSGSNLTLSEAELIAAARNTYGGSISAATTSRADLIESLVNAAGGSVSAATHSEGEMLAALATALGGTASALTNSFHESLAAAVEAAEGGGGEENWWEETALIDIDLVGGAPQGRAWVSGTGEVAVDTLLGTDADTTTALGPSEYNAANLIAGSGYNNGASSLIAFIGAAKTAALAGATFVARFKQIDTDIGSGDGMYLIAVESTGTYGVDADIYPNDLNAVTWNFSDGFNNGEFINSGINVAQDAINVIGWTLDGFRSDLSVNGSAAVTMTMDAVSLPPGSLDAAVVSASNSIAIQRITIYDALPSTAGLSELSTV